MNYYLGLYGFNKHVVLNIVYQLTSLASYYIIFFQNPSKLTKASVLAVYIGIIYRILIISSTYAVLNLSYKYNIQLKEEEIDKLRQLFLKNLPCSWEEVLNKSNQSITKEIYLDQLYELSEKFHQEFEQLKLRFLKIKKPLLIHAQLKEWICNKIRSKNIQNIKRLIPPINV